MMHVFQPAAGKTEDDDDDDDLGNITISIHHKLTTFWDDQTLLQISAFVE